MKKKEPMADERLQQYLGGRYGQRDKTRERYAEAIQACGSIGFLDLTVGEIAKMFGHTDQCLRNQLKRHFPEMLAERERIRVQLGLNKQPLRGVSAHTEAKYAPAIELLRTTDLTVAEIALKCNVMTHNFQCYLQRWCRSDIAVREKLRREKLERQRKERAAMEDRSRTSAAQRKYAPALKLIKEGATYREAAQKLGVNADSLYRWVRKYHIEIHRQELRNQSVAHPNL